MREHRAAQGEKGFSILTVDDDPLITATIQAYFQRSGYCVDAENDPVRAVERVREGSYDILLLDFLMTPICGDEVVARIRAFDQEISIILLTGHRSMAPPLRTVRELSIQGYYEKSERFDQLELLVESCVKSIVQMRTVRRYQVGLTDILDTLPDLYKSREIADIAREAIHRMDDIMDCRSSALYLKAGIFPQPPAEGGLVAFATGSSCFPEPTGGGRALLRSLKEGGGVLQRDGWLLLSLTDEAGKTVGALAAEFETPPDHQQRQLMQVFVRQLAVVLHNAKLGGLLQRKNEELAQTNERMKDSYAEMISALRLMVDAKDDYTRGHSDRVSYYAQRIARRLGRDDDYCERVRLAGLFHDVGKMSIPDRILLKDDGLTEEEYDTIKNHSEAGARILSSVRYFEEILPIIRAHHERLDGGGYPDGLLGEQIPEEARIIAVADAYDAMTSDRRYRHKIVRELVLEELRSCSGKQFDPRVVTAFLDIMEDTQLEQREELDEISMA